MSLLKKSLPVFIGISIILLLLYPGQCITAAKDALNMWLYSVVPSLLPFFILSSLLVKQCVPAGRTVRHERVAKHMFGLPPASLYAIFTGMVSGYPAGARITGEMVRTGVLSPEDALRTLPYTLCCSPTFLVGTVCTALLQAPELALILALSHFGGAILCGQFYRVWYGLFQPRLEPFRETGLLESQSLNLVTATERAMKSMLFVGGNMVLFSIFIQQLQLLGLLDWCARALHPVLSVLGLNPALGTSVAEGVIEMANGCGEVAKIAASLWQQGAAALIILSFGSLSVAAQSAGMLRGTPLRLRHYIFPKLVHTAIAFTLYILLTPFLAPSAASVFGQAYLPLLQKADVSAVALVFSIFGTICYIILLLCVYNRKKRI
ncbi:MAG: nucleoside recognition domain-containing protein [Bacillota bacterium]